MRGPFSGFIKGPQHKSSWCCTPPTYQVAPYDLLAGLQVVQDDEVMQRMKQAALKLQEEALQPDGELISS